MSYGSSFEAVGAAPNSNNTYEPHFVNNIGAVVTASATVNTKGGNATISVNPTANAWAGFRLFALSSGGSRFLVDISFDNGATWAIQNLFIHPNIGSETFNFPLNVPAGAVIIARCQSATASATINLAIEGVIRNSLSPPLYNTAAALTTADTGATRPQNTAVSETGTYTNLCTTAAAFSALFAVAGDNGSFTQQQAVSIALTTGASGADTEIARWGLFTTTGNPGVSRGVSPLFELPLASGVLVNARAYASNTSDSFRVQIFGFR